jgi:hypothetical protein
MAAINFNGMRKGCGQRVIIVMFCCSGVRDDAT